MPKRRAQAKKDCYRQTSRQEVIPVCDLACVEYPKPRGFYGYCLIERFLIVIEIFYKILTTATFGLRLQYGRDAFNYSKTLKTIRFLTSPQQSTDIHTEAYFGL